MCAGEPGHTQRAPDSSPQRCHSSSVRIRRADERDVEWERHDALFRVHVFRGGDDAAGRSWESAPYDVSDADALDVIGWAQDQAGDDGLFSVALIDESDGRGLVWLVGMDANDQPRNEQQRRQRAAMFERRGKPVIRGAADE